MNSVVAFQSGNITTVKPSVDTLIKTLNNSNPGDTLVLENGGEYLMTRFAEVHHPVTIMANSGNKPVIRSQKPNFINIESWRT